MEAGIHPAQPANRLRRVALAALMAVVAMNIWTGGPLLALWVGSRVQAHGDTSLTIRPVAALAVFGTLAAVSVVLMKALRKLSDAYDSAIGAEAPARRHDRWIADDGRGHRGLTLLERTLVVIVMIAALAFEIWFFFFSTSPIDQRSGRSAVPVARQQHPLLAAPQEAQPDRQRSE